MQHIINNTPFKTDKTIAQDGQTGAEVYITAIKATFNIGEGGQLSISEEQKEVCSNPVYFAGEGSSVKYPPDLVLQKKYIDLILNASAYSTGKEAVNEVIARLEFKDYGKELKVTGDRYWKSELGILVKSSPEPFAQKKIRYENAFGGVDSSKDDIPPEERATHPENPVGTGFAVKNKFLEGDRLPNVMYATDKVKKSSKKNRTAGFGAIEGFWSPRSLYAGTYGEKWKKTRFPLYPDDFNPRYYQWAPEDQQIDDISSGDRICLYNMSSEGELYLEIPNVDLMIYSEIDFEKQEHQPKLQTILIEPDERKLMMTWTVEVHHFDQEAETLIYVEQPSPF